MQPIQERDRRRHASLIAALSEASLDAEARRVNVAHSGNVSMFALDRTNVRMVRTGSRVIFRAGVVSARNGNDVRAHRRLTAVLHTAVVGGARAQGRNAESVLRGAQARGSQLAQGRGPIEFWGAQANVGSDGRAHYVVRDEGPIEFDDLVALYVLAYAVLLRLEWVAGG